tara:strand:- start:227 stop:820 length:594 start_codon:yes stop_codon:yes gene_type:complete
MDSILEKNLYLFKEHLGLIKAHNNYDIFDPESKEMILHCREKNLNIFYKIVRIFLKDYKRMTPFEIEIKGLTGKKILKVKKGVSFILSKIQVYDENDNIVGIFKQRLFPFGNNFDMLDKSENLVCKLKGNFIGWNFKFLKGDSEVGLVTKKWAGIGKEMFTSADNYILEIKDKVEKDSPLRLLILAAVLCIDMVIKE